VVARAADPLRAQLYIDVSDMWLSEVVYRVEFVALMAVSVDELRSAVAVLAASASTADWAHPWPSKAVWVAMNGWLPFLSGVAKALAPSLHLVLPPGVVQALGQLYHQAVLCRRVCFRAWASAPPACVRRCTGIGAGGLAVRVARCTFF
jgi:hypothetical protein